MIPKMVDVKLTTRTNGRGLRFGDLLRLVRECEAANAPHSALVLTEPTHAAGPGLSVTWTRDVE